VRALVASSHRRFRRRLRIPRPLPSTWQRPECQR
jgi:hypothetical protein